MLLISVNNYLKPLENLSSFKSGVKTFLFVTSFNLDGEIVFSLFYIYILCMYTDSDGDGDGGDSNCGGGGDIDGGDDVFPIDVCLCHMQLTVWVLMIVSHYF